MNSIFISIGKISITWYSVFILLGVLLATFIIKKEANKNDIPTSFITNLVFWCVFYGIIGARIYYVLFNLDYYAINPVEIIKIWNGGLAIHGGIIAGLLFIIYYCRKNKISSLKFLDIVVVGLILAQAIGRWGNFFNQEAYGALTTKQELMNFHLPTFIINGMYINGNYYQPTFLYESLFDFIGFLMLFFIRFYPYLKVGFLTGFYLIWYGVSRFFIEGMRGDSLMLGNFKMAQIISIIMIVCGIYLCFIKNIKKRKLENLYHKEDF